MGLFCLKCKIGKQMIIMMEKYEEKDEGLSSISW